MTYAATEVQNLLERGPSAGEDFFRMKVTGNGETRWVNITPTQLASIGTILDTDRRGMEIVFSEGTETHYSVCAPLADRQYVVLLTLKGEEADPRKLMVVYADDYGLGFTVEGAPQGVTPAHYTYDQIEKLEIL